MSCVLYVFVSILTPRGAYKSECISVCVKLACVCRCPPRTLWSRVELPSTYIKHACAHVCMCVCLQVVIDYRLLELCRRRALSHAMCVFGENVYVCCCFFSSAYTRHPLHDAHCQRVPAARVWRGSWKSVSIVIRDAFEYSIILDDVRRTHLPPPHNITQPLFGQATAARPPPGWLCYPVPAAC